MNLLPSLPLPRTILPCLAKLCNRSGSCSGRFDDDVGCDKDRFQQLLGGYSGIYLYYYAAVGI